MGIRYLVLNLPAFIVYLHLSLSHISPIHSEFVDSIFILDLYLLPITYAG